MFFYKKNASILLVFLGVIKVSVAQNDKLIQPKYTYQDIDSIKIEKLEELQNSENTPIIFFTKWWIGSKVDETSTRTSYKNHFDIFVLLRTKKNRFNFMRINNFGIQKTDTINFRRLFKFLKKNLKKMKSEVLKPNTVEIEWEGKIVEISSPLVGHELEYRIDIFDREIELHYIYRPSWEENRSNLNTIKYDFLKKIDKKILKIL